MTLGNYPDKYLLFNQQLSKHLAIVLKIEGVPDLYGISDTYTNIRYGDAGIVYGLPGVVYGGLRRLGQVKPYLQLDTGLTIQQRVEPEQGKGNIGTINVSLIDYNGEISNLVAPGQVVDEIMAGKLCTLYIGFTETSFPGDYVTLYRGFITQVTCPPGKVILQISDCTMKSRQPIFNIASTTLSDDVPATGATATLTVGNTGVLHQQILGPNGTYDPTVSTYLVVDSEIMQYAATGILSPTQVLCTRPVLGTQLAAHTAGATVNGAVGFGFNSEGINAIDLALKLLLSGWDGPAETDIPILSFVYDYNGNFVPSEFVLKSDDAILDLGLTVGDYFSITESASGNNLSGKITGLFPGVNGQTVIVKTNQTFTLENPSTAMVAFRSQYDTFPITCGVACSMAEVDTSTFQALRSSYFTSGIYNLRGYYDSAVDGKTTVDGDIMLPLGCYSISRYGRISMAITKPPLPGAGTKLVQVDWTNVLDPDKIVVTRATNQRSFYNEISYEYDYDVANQTFNSIQYFIDTDSLNEFGVTTVLPIQAKAISSALGGASLAQSRGNALLARFKNCLITIELTVNWSVGSLLEVSDIVLLRDDGKLQIMNFGTGQRNLGTQLFEVIDRNYQIISGNVRLKLLGGLGFDLTDRFGLYSPSSILDSGCTESKIRITPSFGQTDLPSEIGKWTPLLGMPIQVHSPDWSVLGQSVLIQADPSDGAALLIAPPLAFTPSTGYIMDIGPYPAGTDPTTDQLIKKLYAFFTPTIPVVSGTSTTVFTVSGPNAAKLTVGNEVILRNSDYSTISNPIAIQSVVSGVVTLAKPLLFTPDSTFVVEGIGFKDGTGYYRWD